MEFVFDESVTLEHQQLVLQNAEYINVDKASIFLIKRNSFLYRLYDINMLDDLAQGYINEDECSYDYIDSILTDFNMYPWIQFIIRKNQDKYMVDYDLLLSYLPPAFLF